MVIQFFFLSFSSSEPTFSKLSGEDEPSSLITRTRSLTLDWRRDGIGDSLLDSSELSDSLSDVDSCVDVSALDGSEGGSEGGSDGGGDGGAGGALQRRIV